MSAPQEDRQKILKPCYGFFGPEKKCPALATNKMCKYNHDLEHYKKYYQLKECPNQCENFCKETSRQCANCTLNSKSLIPCHYFFGDDGCTQGEKCHYSHDAEVYMKHYKLKQCRNCEAYCKQYHTLCYNCVKQQRAGEIDAREETKCQGYKCEAMTKFRFCKPCKEANDVYVLNRHR